MTGEETPLDNNALTQRLDVNFALRAAQMGVWEVDPITHQVHWDDRCRELFGLDKNYYPTYQQTLPFIHPDDINRVDEAIKWAMNPQSGGNYNVVYRSIGNDGRIRWIQSMGQSYLNQAGLVYRFSGVAQDITQQVIDRQRIEESETQFRSLIEESPVATALFTGREMQITLANERILGYWGRDKSVVGKLHAEALPELANQPFSQLLDNVFTTGKAYEAKARRANLLVNGVLGTFYFDFTYKPLRNPMGDVYAILATAVDVTEQVEAQQHQKELAAIVDKVPTYVTIANLDGTMRYINPFGQQMVGLKPEEVKGKGLSEFFEPDDMKVMVEEALPALMTQQHWEGRLRMRHFQNGELIPVESTALTLVDSSTGQLEALVTVNRDLRPELAAQHSQLEQLEALAASEERYRLLSTHLDLQVLQRTEELDAANEELAATNEELLAANEEIIATNQSFIAANAQLIDLNSDLRRSNQNLEQFAYIASHDLQEPLRKIQQFSDLLTNQYGNQLGNGVDYLHRMQSAAGRMSTLIRDLLAYSRIATQRETSQTVSLTDVVNAVLSDLDLRIQETGPTVTVDPLPTVLGNASQLEQLFHNLLSNALKFNRRDELGTLIAPLVEVKASLVRARDLSPSVKPNRAVEVYHRIDVIDNGIGFEEKYLDRIFQVFQRLHGKNEFAGTGIGLAICEKVAANHGGAITANSYPGQGATFSVYLPA